MTDIPRTARMLDRELRAAAAADPLGALTAIGEVQRELAIRESEAVRTAIQRHSWTEIGAALGVSKQAAHQRLARAWATQLREEIKAAQKAHKEAQREGKTEEAAAALTRREALLAEFKSAQRRRKAG